MFIPEKLSVCSESRVPEKARSQPRCCGSFLRTEKFKKVSFTSKGRTSCRQHLAHSNEFAARELPSFAKSRHSHCIPCFALANRSAMCWPRTNLCTGAPCAKRLCNSSRRFFQRILHASRNPTPT